MTPVLILLNIHTHLKDKMNKIETAVIIFQMMGVEAGALYEPKMESNVYGAQAERFCERIEKVGLDEVSDKIQASGAGASSTLFRYGHKKGLKPVIVDYTCSAIELTEQ